MKIFRFLYPYLYRGGGGGSGDIRSPNLFFDEQIETVQWNTSLAITTSVVRLEKRFTMNKMSCRNEIEERTTGLFTVIL